MKQVEVVSASPLTVADKNRIEETFRTKLGGGIQFNYVIDGNIIGGIRVIAGDTVYDGSVSGKLDSLRNLLKE